MTTNSFLDTKLYVELLSEVKTRINQAQMKAALATNREMLFLYWDIGRIIHLRQQDEGWGTSVIPRLSKDLCNELSDVKGFSERNMKRMTQFYKAYPKLLRIGPPAVAQLIKEPLYGKGQQTMALLDKPDNEDVVNIQHLVSQIPWSHNVLLIQKVKDLKERAWYMRQIIEEGWGRETLSSMIKSKAFERQGEAVTNFVTVHGDFRVQSRTLTFPFKYVLCGRGGMKKYRSPVRCT